MSPRDPFGRPLDTHAPEIVPPGDLARRVAERDAEDAALEEDDDDLSDLEDIAALFGE